MQEVKYCYQNIEAIVERDTVLIKNKNLFIATSAFDCVVTVEKEGIQCYRYALMTDVPPLSQKRYDLPHGVQTEPGEYAVTVSFQLREATSWAQAGHEVAFGQCVYQVETAAKPVRTGKMEVIHGRLNIGVLGDGWDALFSNNLRGLVSYRFGGRELLKSGPQANFWRAPTDNDRGNFLPARRGQWKLASQYSSMNRITDVAFIAPVLVETPEEVTITYRFEMPTTPSAQYCVCYKVTPDGTISVSLDCTAPAELADPPEFGILLKLDADYNQVRWYGYGPEETYVDRCHGARLGIFETTVEGSMAKYLHSQECGNRTGVRWATVTTQDGVGLRFCGEGIHFSALPYTPFELENAAHAIELPPVHDTVVRVSLAQMGIGGDDSWGAQTHTGYLLPVGEPLHFTFTMKGICL